MSIIPGSAFYYLIQFLIVGNLFAFLVGALMVLAPQRLADLFRISNRWISTRRMTKPLEIPRPTDRALLRYPRVLGVILLASAALILIKGVIFISRMSVAEGGKLIAGLYGESTLTVSVWESLWITLLSIILMGAVLAIVVGLMSLFRIGKLQYWFESANHWFSTRQVTKPLDMPHYHLDKMVSARPRAWGSVIMLLALFSALVLWWFVLGA